MSTMLHEFGHAVYDKYNDRKLPFFCARPRTRSRRSYRDAQRPHVEEPRMAVEDCGPFAGAAQRVGASALKTLRSEMLIFLRWAIMLVRFERSCTGIAART